MADEADVLAVRVRLGRTEPPDDFEIDEALDRLGDVDKTVFEFLQMRLADLRARPAKLTIDGDRTEDWSGNLAALEKAVAEAQAKVDGVVVDSGTLSTTRIVRPSRDR